MATSTTFKLTFRTFTDVFNALTTLFPKIGSFLWTEIAGFFDTVSELINIHATDLLDPITREAAFGMAQWADYDPVEADGATDVATITLNAAGPKTLPVGYQVSGVSDATGQIVIYELTAIGDSGGTDTITVNIKQHKTITDQNIGIIDRQDPFMDYPIDGFFKILKTSISLKIDSLTWTRVDNFDTSSPTDRHFVIIYQSDSRARVGFGDGVKGLLPALNETIFATFKVTQGLRGQMEAGDITINTGADTDIQSITNAGSSGGNESESVASIKRNARVNVRARNIVFTKEDIELQARKADASVVKALGIPGIGVARAQIIPSSGGQPSGALKTTVSDFIIAKSIFGQIPFAIDTTDFKVAAITMNYVLRFGFTEAKVTDLLEFANTLASNARDNMTLEAFDDQGIDFARTTIINVVYPLSGTWGFVAGDNDALTQIISSYRTTLGNKVSRQYGDPLETGSLLLIGESLFNFGVETVSLVTPTNNINTDSVTQIIDTGTVTVSAI